MSNRKKPDALTDEDLDTIAGGGSVKLQESISNGKIIPTAHTSASRKVPQDSFSINFAKILDVP